MSFKYLWSQCFYDEEREVERLVKVYKETNKEREEWRTLIQRQRYNKWKRTDNYV
jgi:hypothetical protein